MTAPATQKIGTAFGRKGPYWAAGYHTGVDLLTPNGTTLKAPADSTIIFVGRGGWGSAYGIQVIGECTVGGKKYRWITAHMSSTSVKKGQKVKINTVIGKSNSTGNVTGPHCHFEVRYATKSARDGLYGYWDHVNPSVLLNVKASSAPPKPQDIEDIRANPANYGPGKTGEHITWIGQRLVAHGFGRFYKIAPGPVWGDADKNAVRAFQLSQGWTGADADGLPGPLTLTRLEADPAPATIPVPAEPKVMLPRTAWTATANGREGRPLDKAIVQAITLHYPADGNVTYLNLDQKGVAKLLNAYRNHHVNTNGWADIGYNYAVDQSGRLWFLTGDNVGAHADTYGNTRSLGVLLLLGNNEKPTDAMVNTVKQFYVDKRVRFNKIDDIWGHQEVLGNSTACPGPQVMAFINSGRFDEDDDWPDSAPDPLPIVSQPPAAPKPPVVFKKKIDKRIAIGNVNSGFRTTYDKHVKGIAKLFESSTSSVRFTQESGGRNEAEDLCNAMGPEWKYTREQGKDQRIACAILWDDRKEKMLDSGRFDLGTISHDTAAWAFFENRETGVLWMALSTILWPFPIGPNNTASDDKKRRDTMMSALKQGRAYCAAAAKKHDVKHIPIVPGGDLNHDKDDKPDAPGDAFDKYDFKDSDVAIPLAKRKNGKMSTHANPGGLKAGGRIDRVGIDEKGVTGNSQETIYTYPHMDHNIVVVSVTLTNDV